MFGTGFGDGIFYHPKIYRPLEELQIYCFKFIATKVEQKNFSGMKEIVFGYLSKKNNIPSRKGKKNHPLKCLSLSFSIENIIKIPDLTVFMAV